MSNTVLPTSSGSFIAVTSPANTSGVFCPLVVTPSPSLIECHHLGTDLANISFSNTRFCFFITILYQSKQKDLFSGRSKCLWLSTCSRIGTYWGVRFTDGTSFYRQSKVLFGPLSRTRTYKKLHNKHMIRSNIWIELTTTA